MSWEDIYQSRLLTLSDAAGKIKSGDRVLFGHAIGEPTAIIDTMVANKDQYENVEIVHMVFMGKGAYCQPGMERHFRHNSLFVGVPGRKAIMEGRGDFTPCYFSLIPSLFSEGYLPVDVFMMQVSPPDKHGYVSLGVSVDYAVSAVQNAKLVVAQVNRFMPRTHGQSFVHVSDIDWFVEHDAALIELPSPQITDVERQIGKNCAALIKDGDTIQLGIGSLPDAVLLFLEDKKDLGIHSEMISDGVLKLIEKGVITNKRKTLHPGKLIVTFLMGSERFYSFADDNPMFQMMPVDYTNDVDVIAANDNMVAINSCVQVDLTGQVASESIGLMQISSVGGQVDFVRGANKSKGGRSIIAMTSTASGGKISKIVPLLDQGTAVTTNRNDVRYIVTEYGIADLFGKTLRERARQLINVAHPDFRDGLVAEWERRFCTRFN